LHKRRNTLVKERILPSLQIAATTIKAETTAETTETLVATKHTNNLIATADLRDVATSARKRIANYRNI
jgi:hypothetical protein